MLKYNGDIKSGACFGNSLHYIKLILYSGEHVYGKGVCQESCVTSNL